MNMNQPWFWKWNYHCFDILFQYLPPRPRTVDWFQFVIANPLLSTWIFAAAFSYYWTKNDDHRSRRRAQLLETVLTLLGLVLVTVILRPWVRWPAPNLNPAFQPLFPGYLWGGGNSNCFPSHSTLAYFTVAIGFYSLNRWVSMALMIATILLVSLPRVYVGGHYPVDVLFSCALAGFGFLLVRRIGMPDFVLRLANKRPQPFLMHALMFLWIFELGEAFRGSELLFGALHHWWLRSH